MSSLLTGKICGDTMQPASKSARPHRLVAQDEALSRLKPGFEFPWGHMNDSHLLGWLSFLLW